MHPALALLRGIGIKGMYPTPAHLNAIEPEIPPESGPVIPAKAGIHVARHSRWPLVIPAKAGIHVAVIPAGPSSFPRKRESMLTRAGCIRPLPVVPEPPLSRG